MRTFISIDLSIEVKNEIRKIQNSLPDFIGKKTEFENLHLTLKFLGEIDERKVDEVRKRLFSIKINDFDTEIDSIGIFSENFIRIVWLHIKGAEQLQKAIDDVLGDIFQPEARFMSHITIARVKNIKDKKEFLKELKKIKIPEIRFNVSSFNLKKSELSQKGPIYDIIEEFRLS